MAAQGANHEAVLNAADTQASVGRPSWCAGAYPTKRMRHVAAARTLLSKVVSLCSQGNSTTPSINMRCAQDAWTPLMYAAELNANAVAALLLDCGIGAPSWLLLIGGLCPLLLLGPRTRRAVVCLGSMVGSAACLHLCRGMVACSVVCSNTPASSCLVVWFAV